MKSTIIEYINNSFFRLTGQHLPAPTNISNINQWLDQTAPYSLLAHNTEADPHFIYANHQALFSFGYPENEMLQLKSKFSALEVDRVERSRLLDIVHKNGIAFHYTGPRVRKNKEIFTIHHGIVWTIFDENQKKLGQAALFWLEENVPDWFTSYIAKAQK